MTQFRRRIVVVNRFRFSLFLAFLLVVIAVAAMFLFVRPAKAAAEPEAYTVQRGDTLWRLSTERVPQTMDKRDYIESVLRLNHRSDAQIRAGETILLPVLEE